MKKDNELNDRKLTNREKKRRAKKEKGWCEYCDAAMVEDNKKCPRCKKICKRKREKK